jgi:teichuronic acid biosynthesis glycosyltransferase TuaH
MAGRCGEELSVYWAQDDFVGGASLLGLPSARLAKGEARLMSSADSIIAANPLVQDSIARAGYASELIPYGCDADHFAKATVIEPAPGVNLPEPIIGFMGHLGDRIDLAMLGAVADLGESLLLVGPLHPRTDPAIMGDILARTNVQWVGGQDFADLPAWLAHMQLGILPYNHSPFNEGSFPLKTLEYLAAGLPVVASDLPAIRWLDTPHISIADAPADFAAAVSAALATPRTPESDQARQDFAAGHTWDHRAAAIASVLRISGHHVELGG